MATLMEDAPSGDAIIKSNGFDFLLLPKMSYLCCNVAHLSTELITISTRMLMFLSISIHAIFIFPL